MAESGADRGENIYWHKCWACHNKYQQAAPTLEGLFKQPALITGVPVNEENVAAHIKKGGPGMPSFRTTLSDSDVADVVSYLHSEKCCVEGEHLPANPWYRSETNKWTVQNGLSGGANGTVRVASGDSPEGVMVQLIAPNGVRTTVYTNEDGKYEFPKMQAGAYILRIANPLEFKPYRRDSVQIDGATKLEDIVLERIAKTRALPATPEVEAQLSGEEILWNLPGTVEEKEALHNTCALGCHSFQQIFKNRYDERSWGVLVARMLHRGGGPLINDPLEPVSDSALATDKLLTKWLARGSRAGFRGRADVRVPAADRGIQSRGGDGIRAAPRVAKRPRCLRRWKRKHLVHKPSEPLLRKARHAHGRGDGIPGSPDAGRPAGHASRVRREERRSAHFRAVVAQAAQARSAKRGDGRSARRGALPDQLRGDGRFRCHARMDLCGPAWAEDTPPKRSIPRPGKWCRNIR